MWRFFQGFSRSLRTRTPAPPSQTAPRTEDNNDNSLGTALTPPVAGVKNQSSAQKEEFEFGRHNTDVITRSILGQPSEADILLREFFGPTWKNRGKKKENNSDEANSEVISDRLLCVGLGSLWVTALAVGRAAFTTWRSRRWQQQSCDGVASWHEFSNRRCDAVIAVVAKDDLQFYPANRSPRRSNFWGRRLGILPQSISKSTILACGNSVNSKSETSKVESVGKKASWPLENAVKLKPNKKSVAFDQDSSGDSIGSKEQNGESGNFIPEEAREEFTRDARRCSGATYDILGLQNVRTKNYKEAFQHFKLGAKEGYSKAFFNVGLCYEQGIGTEKDITKAIEAYEKAAQKGHAKAQYNLGLILMEKNAITNTVYALRMLEKAALNGLVQAQSYLGSYLANDSEFQDMKKAVKMFKLAAEQGDVKSKYHLAICYERGLGGLQQDLLQAFDLYSSAATSGNLDANYQMAVMLNTGFDGLKKDQKLAYQLLTSAARSSHRPSVELLMKLRSTQAGAPILSPGRTTAFNYSSRLVVLKKEPSSVKDHPLVAHDTIRGRLQMNCNKNEAGTEFFGTTGIQPTTLRPSSSTNGIVAPHISQRHSSSRAASDFDDRILTMPHDISGVADFLRLPRSSTTPNLCYHSPVVKNPGNVFSLEV